MLMLLQYHRKRRLHERLDLRTVMKPWATPNPFNGHLHTMRYMGAKNKKPFGRRGRANSVHEPQTMPRRVFIMFISIIVISENESWLRKKTGVRSLFDAAGWFYVFGTLVR